MAYDARGSVGDTPPSGRSVDKNQGQWEIVSTFRVCIERPKNHWHHSHIKPNISIVTRRSYHCRLQHSFQLPRLIYPLAVDTPAQTFHGDGQGHPGNLKGDSPGMGQAPENALTSIKPLRISLLGGRLCRF